MTSAAKRVLDQLRAFESPNMLAIEPDGSWPIVWERARGAHVWDVDGKRYIDLTAAFGVAAAGHANPRVVSAGRRQMSRLPHAMGDVHPHAPKAQLARELSRITFERWSAGRHAGKTIFNNSGFEAVEAALKTAILATGRQGIVAFEGAYHGLGYGALNVTHRSFFRDPFRPQLREFGHFVRFPKTAENLKELKKQIKRLLDTKIAARFLWSQFRRGAASMCRPPVSCQCCAPVATNPAHCWRWMRFTRDSAARESGSRARKAGRCRT